MLIGIRFLKREVHLVKKRMAAIGAATALCVVGWVGTPFYITAVVILDWYSYIVFPPLAGLMALGLICLGGESGKTVEEFIEERVKGRKRRILMFLFRKIKPLALVFSALFIGPAFTPIITELCVSNIKKAYFISIILNVFATAVWIWVYLGGKSIVENFLDIIKLSIGA